MLCSAIYGEWKFIYTKKKSQLSGKCFAAWNIAIPSTRDVIPHSRGGVFSIKAPGFAKRWEFSKGF